MLLDGLLIPRGGTVDYYKPGSLEPWKTTFCTLFHLNFSLSSSVSYFKHFACYCNAGYSVGECTLWSPWFLMRYFYLWAMWPTWTYDVDCIWPTPNMSSEVVRTSCQTHNIRGLDTWAWLLESIKAVIVQTLLFEWSTGLVQFFFVLSHYIISGVLNTKQVFSLFDLKFSCSYCQFMVTLNSEQVSMQMTYRYEL